MLQKQKIASEQLQDSNNVKKRHHETETENTSKQHQDDNNIEKRHHNKETEKTSKQHKKGHA